MLLFENDQWRVTDAVLELTKPFVSSAIPRSDLLRVRKASEGDLYEWPLHMAEKSWVDLEAFIEAYLAALKLWNVSLDQGDKQRLEASLHRARNPPSSP